MDRKELEGENLFCYLQVEEVSSANDLSVSNSLMQDVSRSRITSYIWKLTGALTQHFTLGSSSFTFSWK
ncbi:MAG: hypothetical protein IPO90_10220 [Flavobacteriales bacterium]|nr:hypothetical protein [Flavobacteriales bacterium]